jgi:hypothetical protein
MSANDEDESPGDLGSTLDALCEMAGMPRVESVKGDKVLSKREALAVLSLIKTQRKILEGLNGNSIGDAGAV